MEFIELTLELPLKSKARPRFAKGRTYMPSDYRDWKEKAKTLLRSHWEREGLPTIVQAEHISLRFYGPARHDLDNLCGAVLDSGLPTKDWSGAWKDDRVTVFPSICASFTKSSESRIDVLIITDKSHES